LLDAAAGVAVSPAGLGVGAGAGPAGRDQASTSVQSAAIELVAFLNASGMPASISWLHNRSRTGEGAPSGSGLDSTRLTVAKVCSTCR